MQKHYKDGSSRKTLGMLLLEHLASERPNYEFAEKETLDSMKKKILPFIDDYPIVAITRPFEALADSENYVIKKGLLPVSSPMIELFPNRTEDLSEFLKRMEENGRNGRIVVIFTSRNGIRFLKNYIAETGLDKKRLLKECQIWVI